MDIYRIGCLWNIRLYCQQERNGHSKRRWRRTWFSFHRVSWSCECNGSQSPIFIHVFLHVDPVGHFIGLWKLGSHDFRCFGWDSLFEDKESLGNDCFLCFCFLYGGTNVLRLWLVSFQYDGHPNSQFHCDYGLPWTHCHFLVLRSQQVHGSHWRDGHVDSNSAKVFLEDLLGYCFSSDHHFYHYNFMAWQGTRSLFGLWISTLCSILR